MEILIDIQRAIKSRFVRQALEEILTCLLEVEVYICAFDVDISRWSVIIYLFLPPALNPKSYGRARVLEAPSRPMLVIGRSYYEEMLTGEETMTGEDVRTNLMGLS